MKKLFLSLALASVIMGLAGCRTTRVYVDQELEEMAYSDFGFSDFYCFKIVSSETANVLTGSNYRNSGIIAGRIGTGDRLIFVPKKVAQEPFLLDWPYLFSMTAILDALHLLEDDQGQPLNPAFFEDFGGLSIGVEYYSTIADLHPELVFDTTVVFTFTIWDEISSSFHILQANGELVLFSDTYELLN